MEVPRIAPVTKPVDETEAMVEEAESQGVVAKAFPEPISCVVEPMQVFKFPVIVGRAFMVTLAFAEHPKLFVKVIVTVPPATPVTTPILETEAINPNYS
jgi:hypothetical protein